jgi:osmoprotectant transport system permease protein
MARFSKDQTALLLFAAGLLVLAVFLPWVMQRPNRLAQGTPLPLPWFEAALGVLLAFLLPWQRLALSVSSAALVLGFFWLGQQTTLAVVDLSALARASANTGFWVWMLGAGIGFYTALLADQSWWRVVAWWWLPATALLFAFAHLGNWSVMLEFRVQQARFFQELLQNFYLIGAAVLAAAVCGMPLAVWASRRPKAAAAVLGVAGGVQTIPSLALLGLLIAPLAALANALPWLRALGVAGIGTAPALIAMTLYALLPILRNGVVALLEVSAGALEAARGMGMTENQRFWRVQLPLALPVWLSGFRQAVVVLVGVSSVAQLIGAGGLGFFIFSGLQNGASDLILLGAIPLALFAILADALLRGAESVLGSRLGRA